MCGIVGFVHGGKVRSDGNRADWFTSALYAGALRGLHSTGVFMIESDLEPYMMKAAHEAAMFLDRRSTAEVLDGLGWGTKVAVGHNRHATLGKVNYDNAHPYVSQDGNITLVHNGTLKAYHHMQTHHEADTDSARICAQLAEETPENSIKILEELNGAYALVWYDKRNCALNIVRNEERPLSYLKLENDQLFFTSEGDMCSWLTARHGLSDQWYECTDFEPHTLYRFHSNDQGEFDLNAERTEYTARPFALPPRTGNKVVPIGNGTGGSGKGHECKNVDKLAKRLKKALIKAKPNELVEVQGSWVEPYRFQSGAPSATGQVQGWFDVTDQNFLTEDGFQGHLFMDIHNVPVPPENSAIEIDTYRARITGLRTDAENGVTLVGVYVCMLQHRFHTNIWSSVEVVEEVLDGQRWKYDAEDKAIHRHDHFKCMFTSREVDEFVKGYSCMDCGKDADYVPAMETFFPARCITLGPFVCGDCYGKEVLGEPEDAPCDVVKPDVSH